MNYSQPPGGDHDVWLHFWGGQRSFVTFAKRSGKGGCKCTRWSVWGPPGAAEPAAQPARWLRAAVAIAMKPRFSQASVGPAIIGHVLPQPQLSIGSFVPNLGPLCVAGGQGAGGGAGLLSLHSQEGGQVQVQARCSSSGPRCVLSTLRTRDPDLGRTKTLHDLPSRLSKVKHDWSPGQMPVDDVISHLIVNDRVQSLQARLAEGVSTMQSPWQPRGQVVATKAHDAHQVLSPWRCQHFRGKRREGLTRHVLLFVIFILFSSAVWHFYPVGHEKTTKEDSSDVLALLHLLLQSRNKTKSVNETKEQQKLKIFFWEIISICIKKTTLWSMFTADYWQTIYIYLLYTCWPGALLPTFIHISCFCLFSCLSSLLSVCCDCLMFSFLLCCLLFHLSFCSSFVFGFCLLSPWSVLPFSPWIFFLLFLPCLFPLLSFFLPHCSSLLVLSFCSSASCRKKERERESPSSIIKPYSTDRRAGHQVSETYRISKNFHKAESCEMDFNHKKKTSI